MKRKEFLMKLPIAVLGISFLSSCSDDKDDDVIEQLSCIENGTSAAIGSNHGHTLEVSKRDVELGVEKTYNIQGSSEHRHSVTVTESDFVALQNNNSVRVQSTTDEAHSHSVTVSCA